MNVKTYLSVLFTLLTATILLFFVIATYFSSKSARENEFYNSLKKEGITKANLLIKTGIAPETLQEIYRSNKTSLNEVEVAIYDKQHNLLYHDAVEIDFVKETPELLNRIDRDKEVFFYQQDWQVAGIEYEADGQQYLITTAGYDEFGYREVDTLVRNSLLFFILSIVVIYLAGIFFSGRALAPIRAITKKVNSISATSLDSRLETLPRKDELYELTATFNQMLDRLEQSFGAQKSFVSNIAHEVRTPLTAIITELELANRLDADNSVKEKALQNTLADAQRLARLTSSLLDLAKASYDSAAISIRPVRIDEVILDARLKVQQENPGFQIGIRLENGFENEDPAMIHANEYLLRVAFSNLFENGCKFSPDRRSDVTIKSSDRDVILRFTNTGAGIPLEDIPHLFTPFYRGSDRANYPGNGIGLSLVDKIISLHKGTVEVASVQKAETTFTIRLPRHQHII